MTQAHKDEIQAWLQSDNKDFDIGYELFVRFGHNRALALFLARKRKLSKLEYELQKIMDRLVVKEAPGMPLKPVKQIVKVAEAKAKGTRDADVKLAEQGKLVVVHENRINYDELPEELKKLYDENLERYKKMRALHEKMKLATTDQERAEHRSALVYLDDKLAETWAILDNWAAGNGTEQAESQAKDAAEVAKEINAARSYLSRNVKGAEKLTGEKREKMLDNLRQRLDVLQKHKADLKPETRHEIFKLGLITDWREVQ